VNRRSFISLLGGAMVTWPFVVRAQQPAIPVIGLLAIATPTLWVKPLEGFRRGLKESGYVEGQNAAIEYRWAHSQFDRVPALAADLVRRQVAVIFATGPPAVRAAQAADPSIPIVFSVGEDPVKEGLVASLNRPGGNATGVTNFQNLLYGKQLGLLREIVPHANSFALLVNPSNPNAEADAKDAEAAADALRLKLRVLGTRTENDFEQAFQSMVQESVGGLLVGVDSLFFDRREPLFALTSRYRMPAIYHRQDYPVEGGLLSYGASPVEAWRQCGIYVGRILKGERPANLPVVQAAKFVLVINLKTARVLGLTIPPGILAIADEVIE
jgi:putative ABC transport system substrate-binding protein